MSGTDIARAAGGTRTGFLASAPLLCLRRPERQSMGGDGRKRGGGGRRGRREQEEGGSGWEECEGEGGGCAGGA
eukprot:1625125-Rhodomonas_salina.1